MSIIKKVLFFLSKKEKYKALVLIFVIIGLSILETFGIASVLPLLTLLSNPSAISENQYLNYFYKVICSYRILSSDEFLIFLASLNIAFIITSTIYKIFANYILNKYIEGRRHSISSRLIKSYILQNYSYFLGKNSTEIIANAISEVDQFIQYIFRPFITMFANISVSIFILLFLVWYDFTMAFGVVSLLVLTYIIIFYFIRKKIIRLGNLRSISNQERFKSSAECFNAIKYVKICGLENYFLKSFKSSSLTFATNLSLYHTIKHIPNYIVEAVVIGSVLVFTILLLLNQSIGNLSEILPIVGLYVLSSYRLKPALQSVYQGVASLKYGTSFIEKLYSEIGQNENKIHLKNQVLEKCKFENELSLRNITYKYNNSQNYVLKNINLKIAKGSKIAIIGKSGVGKTSLIDIILGLHKPHHGNVSIDGIDLDYANLNSYQNLFGYVPQDIVLSDKTISENIAFGIDRDQINMKLVVDCAMKANLNDFITQELENGYNQRVGERGIRLSGGQRQRIGIARALYNNPEVLVLDEASSALDNATEEEVLSNLFSFNKNLTIIIVSHRLKSIMKCDAVFYMEKLAYSYGSYEYLLRTNQSFNNLSKND